MTTKQRTKLELIRIEGICRMLLKKVEGDKLKNLMETVTKNSPNEIKSAIYRLARYQLIKVIELAGSDITSKDIDDAYEQYRYGLKPGFTLYSINQKCKNKSPSTVFNAVKNDLGIICYAEDENIKSITAKSYSKINKSVVEYSFYYLNKHSYLTEKEEPAFVYEYEECYAWIDMEHSFLAMKNAPEKVLTIIKRTFSTAYATQFTGIKLTKRLIRDVFGNDNIKKGSFIKPNASDDEAEKLIVSDSRFSEKQAVQNSVSGYNMTGTYLNEVVEEGQNNTLGINCEKGKLYLTSNVNATFFREWSIRRITSIISYLSEGADFSDFDVFKAKNIMDSSIWAEFSTRQKELLERIIYAVYVSASNRQERYTIEPDTLDIKNTMKNSFYDRVTAYCDGCEELFIPRCMCGSTSLNVTKNGQLLCAECGQVIDGVSCEEGHNHRITSAFDVLVLYPQANLLRRITESIRTYLNINIVGGFYIYSGYVTLLPETTGNLVQATMIPELRTVMDIQLSEDEYNSGLRDVQNIKEKCRKTKNRNCNSCLLSDKSNCMMKLFSLGNNYRPSPHQAGEFGDVSFTVTYNGSQCELVGIAKSAQTGKDVLNLSESPSRDMLQQVLRASHDARIGIIAAICPIRFHDQLVEELRYIANLTAKPIVILDDMFMVRQYIRYKSLADSTV